MYDERTIELLTGLNLLQRNLLGELYAGLDEEMRVEIHRRQRDLFKEWLSVGRFASSRAAEAGYAAFLDVLKLLWIEQAGNAGQQLKPRKQHKQRLRASLEKKYLSELVRLREEEKLSWRQLSEHFKKQFRKTVSHTYLKRIYEEHLAGKE
jgi:gamma-glutamyl:cysteine ligase YbdK (ATP-grasp superfamily)